MKKRSDLVKELAIVLRQKRFESRGDYQSREALQNAEPATLAEIDDVRFVIQALAKLGSRERDTLLDLPIDA